LESDFPKITFRKTNTVKRENTFLETKPNFSLIGKCFSLTGKCFPLTNFPNGKQTQESLESGFPKITFRETNMALMLLDKTNIKNNLIKKNKMNLSQPSKLVEKVMHIIRFNKFVIQEIIFHLIIQQ